MVLYCAFFCGLRVYKKIYFQFCTALFCTALFCLSSNPNFFEIVLEFYKCIELQYFDLELTFNCLLSINEICWFWWSEQLKKSVRIVWSSQFKLIHECGWIIYDETKIFTFFTFFTFFVHILVETLSWIFSDLRSRKNLLEEDAIEKTVAD